MKTAITLAIGALAMAAPAMADQHENMGQPAGHPQMLMTGLLGASEVAGGDEDGRGQFMAWIGEGDQFCYRLMVSNIAPATGAHVHMAPAGANGGVVIALTAPADGSSGGCVASDADTLGAIWAEPGNYYVNVHNADFPAGALRGQLVSHDMPGGGM